MLRVTKQGLRGFACGILFSAAVLSVVYYSELPQAAAPVQAESVQKEDPKSQPIKEVKLPEESSTAKESTEPQTTDTPPAKPPAKPEKKVYTYQLVIGKGMSPEEVANKLVEAHILSEKKEFLKYLNDYSLMGSVRFGTYDLNSNMKIIEIAQIITKTKAK
ncbi:hypothetical protein [Aneurinibacillus sp. REN35]|uniref:hypothetical protein n=1 Tax=Aneurinibacillus sp. REN35 TaxID=3237286 RepID=UPI0035298A8B